MKTFIIAKPSQVNAGGINLSTDNPGSSISQVSPLPVNSVLLLTE